MAVSIVRLGTKRSAGEGLRIGTVRRPPRGVAKSEFASGNWYDVWLPEISPSAHSTFSPRYLGAPSSRSAATAKTRRAATARSCARC